MRGLPEVCGQRLGQFGLGQPHGQARGDQTLIGRIAAPVRHRIRLDRRAELQNTGGQRCGCWTEFVERGGRHWNLPWVVPRKAHECTSAIAGHIAAPLRGKHVQRGVLQNLGRGTQANPLPGRVTKRALNQIAWPHGLA